MFNTGNKSLDMLFNLVFFLAGLLWFLEGFMAPIIAGFNWMAFIFFWWGLGIVLGMFMNK